LEDPNGIAFFGPAPDVANGIAEEYSKIIFRSEGEIDRYFGNKTGTAFNGWFTRALAGRGAWKNKGLAGPALDANFKAFWAAYLRDRPVSLMEFLVYMSLFINETGGNLVSRTERFGMAGYPGITYLFDRIVISYPDGRRWSKKSYNADALNISAYQLFNDPMFCNAHADRALSRKLAKATDRVWLGDRYPRTAFPFSANERDMGFVLEADFFKFRGRGLIQTTWRSNYKGIAEFVLNYKGNDPLIRRFGAHWRGLNTHEVCTTSRNADWDMLFGDASRTILCESIRQHAASGGYLPLSFKSRVLNEDATTFGSIVYMGRRVGGSAGYGNTLKGRVSQMCAALEGLDT
jgi:hypothetical protein